LEGVVDLRFVRVVAEPLTFFCLLWGVACTASRFALLVSSLRCGRQEEFFLEEREMCDAEVERLRAERDVWIEYVTCDRAELVLKLEAALARAERAEAQLHRQREEDAAIEGFLEREGEGLASGAEYKPR
jgi:hypothetical protein